MKYLFYLTILFLSNFLFAQKPVFHNLKEPNRHAGCYLEGKGGETIGNLTEEGGTLFNFTGKDGVFPAIKPTKEYPEAFGDRVYKIYIKEKKSVKDPDSCIEDKIYSIKIIYKKKAYFYTKKGMCGC